MANSTLPQRTMGEPLRRESGGQKRVAFAVLHLPILIITVRVLSYYRYSKVSPIVMIVSADKHHLACLRDMLA